MKQYDVSGIPSKTGRPCSGTDIKGAVTKEDTPYTVAVVAAVPPRVDFKELSEESRIAALLLPDLVAASLSLTMAY